MLVKAVVSLNSFIKLIIKIKILSRTTSNKIYTEVQRFIKNNINTKKLKNNV